jgi:hypothetical protein
VTAVSVSPSTSAALTAAPSAQHAAPLDVSSGRWRLAPLGLVVLLAALLLVNAAPWLGAGFGESHDGRNAAIWGLSSRALRDDPIGSRFGGELAPGYTYANHPPLIIGETALAETIAGEQRIVTRSPAWLGSVVALFLVCWLLLGAGLSPTAVAAGVVSTWGSAMFLVYGTMLDTPVTSLPFTLAILLAWQRAWRSRPWPIPVVVGLGVLAGLAGWQSFVFTALATAALAYRAIRSRKHWQQPLALGCGASVGLIATFAWIHWVYGSFTPLMANRHYRSDGSGPLGTIHPQWSFLWGLMPMALLVAAVGAAFAVRDARVRALFGLSTVAVIGYGLAFSGGAEIHDYWNYAALIPAAVAASAGVDYLVRTANASRRSLVVVGSLLMATACLVISVTQPTGAQYAIENGVGTVELARVAQRLAGDDPGPVLAYGSAGGALSRWIDYETGRPGLALHSLDDLRLLAERQPDFPVLVVLVNTNDLARPLLTANAIAIEGPYALVPARAVYSARSERTG